MDDPLTFSASLARFTAPVHATRLRRVGALGVLAVAVFFESASALASVIIHH